MPGGEAGDDAGDQDKGNKEQGEAGHLYIIYHSIINHIFLCYFSYITYYMLHILKSIVWLVTSWARLRSCPATFRPRALEPLRSCSSSSSLLENGLYGGSRSGLYVALKEILPLLTFILALLLATKGISFSSDPFLPLNSLVSLSCLRGESHQTQNAIKYHYNVQISLNCNAYNLSHDSDSLTHSLDIRVSHFRVIFPNHSASGRDECTSNLGTRKL